MDLIAQTELKQLAETFRLVNFVARQVNPITGAPIPQTVASMAPQAPPVVL